MPAFSCSVTADLTGWLKRNFEETDYILVKLDVEGAEFDIVERLRDHGALALVDVLALECHGWSGNCTQLVNTVRDAGVEVRMDYEKFVKEEYWQASIAQFREGLKTPSCAHINLTCGEKVCTPGRKPPPPPPPSAFAVVSR